MRRAGAPRIDYTPGPGAQDALDAAAARWPELSQQALLDLLVINGQSAMFYQQWTPPALPRGSREKWRADVPLGLAGSGTSIGGSQERRAEVPELDAGRNAFLDIALKALTKDPP